MFTSKIKRPKSAASVARSILVKGEVLVHTSNIRSVRCQFSISPLIIANGFSCQEQIAERINRVPMHLAQVIQLAMRTGARDGRNHCPEAPIVRSRQLEQRVAYANACLGALGLAAIGFLAWNWKKKQRSKR